MENKLHYNDIDKVMIVTKVGSKQNIEDIKNLGCDATLILILSENGLFWEENILTRMAEDVQGPGVLAGEGTISDSPRYKQTHLSVSRIFFYKKTVSSKSFTNNSESTPDVCIWKGQLRTVSNSWSWFIMMLS